MSCVRMTKGRGREDGRETENIWPFLGVTWMLDRGDVAEAQAPVQSTNCFAWKTPVEVWSSTASLRKRVKRSGVLGRRSIVVARTAASKTEASWRGSRLCSSTRVKV